MVDNGGGMPPLLFQRGDIVVYHNPDRKSYESERTGNIPSTIYTVGVVINDVYADGKTVAVIYPYYLIGEDTPLIPVNTPDHIVPNTVYIHPTHVMHYETLESQLNKIRVLEDEYRYPSNGIG